MVDATAMTVSHISSLRRNNALHYHLRCGRRYLVEHDNTLDPSDIVELAGMEGQRRKHIHYGLTRMKELLDALGYKDMRAKRTTLTDWSIQFARHLTHNPSQNAWNDRRGVPIWDTEWIPVSELERQMDTLEIWPTFRERICSQITIAHAAIGDIINSQGVNTDGAGAGPSLQTVYGTKPKKSSRSARQAPVSVKQEETISLAEQVQDPIDLTMESPPGTPMQDGFYEGAAEQPPQVDGIDAGHIDLTVDEVVDLTVQPTIDLTNDDPSEETPAQQLVPHAPESEELARKDDSDRDPLFDGLEPEPTRMARFADMEIEFEVPPITPEIPSLEARNVPSLQPDSGLGRLKVKKGRKRALEFEDEEVLERPRKIVAFSREGYAPTLLTAVNGKVVEINRDGKLRLFDPSASAGSALAAKSALELNQKGARYQPDSTDRVVYITKPPITNPDELEDYEDEEEPEVAPTRSPSPDPELQAMREKWNRVKMPKVVTDPIAHLLQPGPTLSAPSLFAPPLFLLRISHTRTLRLMARNCTRPHTTFYTVTPAEKARRIGEPFVEEERGPPKAAGFRPKYMRQKVHLLELLPQYHHLAWVASLAKQETLIVDIEAAIRRRDAEKFENLQREYQKELQSNWRLGENERTKVLPRIGDITQAEDILFNQFCAGLSLKLEDALMRRPGSYAELVLYQHGRVGPSEEDKEDYVRLAETLEQEKKFLVIESAVVDEHYKDPHTLIIFASRSRVMGELCGLEEDRMKSRKSLVIVHLGWRLAATEPNSEGCLPIFSMLNKRV